MSKTFHTATLDLMVSDPAIVDQIADLISATGGVCTVSKQNEHQIAAEVARKAQRASPVQSFVLREMCAGRPFPNFPAPGATQSALKKLGWLHSNGHGLIVTTTGHMARFALPPLAQAVMKNPGYRAALEVMAAMHRDDPPFVWVDGDHKLMRWLVTMRLVEVRSPEAQKESGDYTNIYRLTPEGWAALGERSEPGDGVERINAKQPTGDREYVCVDCQTPGQAKPRGRLPDRCPVCRQKRRREKEKARLARLRDERINAKVAESPAIFERAV